MTAINSIHLEVPDLTVVEVFYRQDLVGHWLDRRVTPLSELD